jgi:hypothetical protein
MVPGRTGRRSLIRLAGAAALSTLVPVVVSRAAEARPLSADDEARLARGEVVEVPLDLDTPRGDYFGGVAYVVIDAPVTEVMDVLLDPASYTSILPLTLEARVTGRPGGDYQVFFKQGGRLGTASYTLFARRESLGTIRFWLDPSQPHDIADCWGYFRVLPWGKRASILTYAALVHLDAGLVKLLFTEAIRRYALSTPGLVRAFVQGRRGHAADAAPPGQAAARD